MKRSSSFTLAVLLGVLLAGLPLSQAQEKSDLAPPIAVQAGGMPIDVWPDKDGRTEHDNAYPWFGDFDGDVKPNLLVGQHIHPAGNKKAGGAGGRLLIYKNTGDRGSPRFDDPIFFNDLVPTARIPGG